jgi:hypothetical protein
MFTRGYRKIAVIEEMSSYLIRYVKNCGRRWWWEVVAQIFQLAYRKFNVKQEFDRSAALKKQRALAAAMMERVRAPCLA